MEKYTYEILSKKCLSSQHNAQISGIVLGSCQCGNCKIQIREHRELPPDAWHEIPKYHDYVFDEEEVIKIKDLLKGL